jgi:hypothetical protein
MRGHGLRARRLRARTALCGSRMSARTVPLEPLTSVPTSCGRLP